MALACVCVPQTSAAAQGRAGALHAHDKGRKWKSPHHASEAKVPHKGGMRPPAKRKRAQRPAAVPAPVLPQGQRDALLVGLALGSGTLAGCQGLQVWPARYGCNAQ